MASKSLDIAAITAAVVAVLEAQDSPDTGAQKATAQKGRTKAAPKAASARKAAPKADGYKPDAKRRKAHATARQLWAMNEAGLLTFDGTLDNEPLSFGTCFDAIAATRNA